MSGVERGAVGFWRRTDGGDVVVASLHGIVHTYIVDSHLVSAVCFVFLFLCHSRHL